MKRIRGEDEEGDKTSKRKEMKERKASSFLIFTSSQTLFFSDMSKHVYVVSSSLLILLIILWKIRRERNTERRHSFLKTGKTGEDEERGILLFHRRHFLANLCRSSSFSSFLVSVLLFLCLSFDLWSLSCSVLPSCLCCRRFFSSFACLFVSCHFSHPFDR